jgi:nitrogen regulatory protein P-II 1
MNIKRITAIVPIETLQELEKHMRDCGVPGVTVEAVRGYGEHPNYYRKDLMKDNAKLVLYTVDNKVDEIIDAMSACARECGCEHGIVSVDSVDRLVHLADGTNVSPAFFHG